VIVVNVVALTGRVQPINIRSRLLPRYPAKLKSISNHMTFFVNQYPYRYEASIDTHLLGWSGTSIAVPILFAKKYIV
jgi:hypothetical protein